MHVMTSLYDLRKSPVILDTICQRWLTPKGALDIGATELVAPHPLVQLNCFYSDKTIEFLIYPSLYRIKVQQVNDKVNDKLVSQSLQFLNKIPWGAPEPRWRLSSIPGFSGGLSP